MEIEPDGFVSAESDESHSPDSGAACRLRVSAPASMNINQGAGAASTPPEEALPGRTAGTPTAARVHWSRDACGCQFAGCRQEPLAGGWQCAKNQTWSASGTLRLMQSEKGPGPCLRLAARDTGISCTCLCRLALPLASHRPRTGTGALPRQRAAARQRQPRRPYKSRCDNSRAVTLTQIPITRARPVVCTLRND